MVSCRLYSEAAYVWKGDLGVHWNKGRVSPTAILDTVAVNTKSVRYLSYGCQPIQ
jgi:hypothetical protein